MMIIMINNYLISNSLLEYESIVTLRPFVLESCYREGERRWREGGREGEKREGGRERGKGEGGGRGERCAYVNLLSLSLFLTSKVITVVALLKTSTCVGLLS